MYLLWREKFIIEVPVLESMVGLNILVDALVKEGFEWPRLEFLKHESYENTPVYTGEVQVAESGHIHLGAKLTVQVALDIPPYLSRARIIQGTSHSVPIRMHELNGEGIAYDGFEKSVDYENPISMREVKELISWCNAQRAAVVRLDAYFAKNLGKNLPVPPVVHLTRQESDIASDEKWFVDSCKSKLRFFNIARFDKDSLAIDGIRGAEFPYVKTSGDIIRSELSVASRGFVFVNQFLVNSDWQADLAAYHARFRGLHNGAHPMTQLWDVAEAISAPAHWQQWLYSMRDYIPEPKTIEPKDQK
jgi:hypothetical protein